MTLILSLLFYAIVIWAIGSYKKTVLYRSLPERNWAVNPYLIRYTLLSCKYFTIKIHKALMSDPDEPHDHPWNYISLILKGGYYEERTVIKERTILVGIGDTELRKEKIKSSKFYRPGSILYRRGDQLHRLILKMNKPSWSLILTFKKWRKWGYIDRSGEWKPYQLQ